MAEKTTKTPTAEKRMIQNEKRKIQNKSFKSKVKTAIRAFKESLKHDNKIDESKKTLNTVFSMLDKGAKNNVIKKNKTNRLKSKLTTLFAGKKA